MASDAPNANGSQFFITLAPQPWLDRRKGDRLTACHIMHLLCDSSTLVSNLTQRYYSCDAVAFGRVVSGLRAVLAIGSLETQSERPCAPCVIADCGVIE